MLRLSEWKAAEAIRQAVGRTAGDHLGDDRTYSRSEAERKFSESDLIDLSKTEPFFRNPCDYSTSAELYSVAHSLRP